LWFWFYRKRLHPPLKILHIVRAMRRQREYGVGVNETAAVTETGVEILTQFSRELFVNAS
jgi:Xaa-Pro aminopeptidase